MTPPFNPSDFIAPKAKPLPVILLLDVSGSMAGAKIQNLNQAVHEMLGTFKDTENGETEIHVAVITFGAEVKLHQPLASASDIQWHDLSASGGTPLGTALKMAMAMIEDKGVVPSRAYRPTVVLVSDGHPTDDWAQPLNAFISDGRSAKCDRMAMAIGADADESVLGKFIAGTSNKLCYAEGAKQLREFFKFVTMSVTIRTKSQTPNISPPAADIAAKPAEIGERTEKPKSSAPTSTLKTSNAGTTTNATSTNTADTEEGGYW
jgi:uncharacterized protein YegL